MVDSTAARRQGPLARCEGELRAAFVAETGLCQPRRSNGSYQLLHAERHAEQRHAQAIQQRLLVIREVPAMEGDVAMLAVEVGVVVNDGEEWPGGIARAVMALTQGNHWMQRRAQDHECVFYRMHHC